MADTASYAGAMKTLTPPKPLTAAHRKAAARKVAARPKRRAY